MRFRKKVNKTTGRTEYRSGKAGHPLFTIVDLGSGDYEVQIWGLDNEKSPRFGNSYGDGSYGLSNAKFWLNNFEYFLKQESFQ